MNHERMYSASNNHADRVSCKQKRPRPQAQAERCLANGNCQAHFQAGCHTHRAAARDTATHRGGTPHPTAVSIFFASTAYDTAYYGRKEGAYSRYSILLHAVHCRNMRSCCMQPARASGHCLVTSLGAIVAPTHTHTCTQWWKDHTWTGPRAWCHGRSRNQTGGMGMAQAATGCGCRNTAQTHAFDCAVKHLTYTGSHSVQQLWRLAAPHMP